MEVIKHEEIAGIPGFEEVRVRPDDSDYDYWIYPASVIGKTIDILKKSGITIDAQRADFEHTDMLPLKASSYCYEGLSRTDAIVLQSLTDAADLERAVEYINSHDGVERISIMKYSELPEFAELLDESAVSGTDPEIRAVLDAYMRSLIDMTDGDRMGAILKYEEKADFAKLLLSYSEPVREFVLNRVSSRFETELRDRMSGKQHQ